MTDRNRKFDKRQIARQFSRAASGYDSVSQLQRQMADRLIDQISFDDADGPFVLIDLGCGTGESLEKIASRFRSASAGRSVRQDLQTDVDRDSNPAMAGRSDKGHDTLIRIGIDIAPGMVQQARLKLAADPATELKVADLESTGLEAGIADCVFCNASLQWCDSLSAFREMDRLLKPSGKLLAATFGPETLAELKQAWLNCANQSPPVHSFPSPSELTADLKQVGFDSVSVRSERVKMCYASPQDLLYSLKNLGATHASVDRRRGLLGRDRFQELCDQIQRQMAGEAGIEVTFETLFLQAEKHS